MKVSSIITSVIVVVSVFAIALALFLESDQGRPYLYLRTYLAFGFPVFMTVSLLLRRWFKRRE